MDKRVRSPNYPALSLKEAVEKIGALYRFIQNNPAPREVIAKGLGYNSLNGASATVISALNKYGLLEGRGEDLRVSERAMIILHPNSTEERAQAIRQSAVEPKLFSEIAERFPGGVTSDELLKNYLLRNGFALSAVTPAIQAYRETSEFVVQEAGGYDSAPKPTKDTPTVHSTQTAATAQQAIPNVALHSAQPVGDQRVLHRYDFADGGFVEITVSRDVDAELALEVIEASMPTMKKVTAIEERVRKAAASKEAAAHTSQDAKKDE